MKVGNYKIGRYHGIIKKFYEDGSVDYETDFSSEADIRESIRALNYCKGELVGIATENPQILKDIAVIRGKENIIKELENIDQ